MRSVVPMMPPGLHPQKALPSGGRLLPACRLLLQATLLLLIAAPQVSRADGVGIGGVNIVSTVDPDEIIHKWWFWVVIGITAAFFVVGGYFVWRGWGQWKKQKARELQEEEEERRLAEEEAKLGVGRVQVVPVKGGTVDVELGYMPGVKPPAPGEPLSEEQLEFLRERERRTAVHQKQRW